MSSKDDPSSLTTRRGRGRPRVHKRIRVGLERRERLDIWKLALVLHGVAAREEARKQAQERERLELTNHGRSE